MALNICDITPQELEAIFIMRLDRGSMTSPYKAGMQK